MSSPHSHAADPAALDLAENFGNIGGALVDVHGPRRIAEAFLAASLTFAIELGQDDFEHFLVGMGAACGVLEARAAVLLRPAGRA